MNITLKEIKDIIHKKYDISKYKNVYIIGCGKSLENVKLKKINYKENFIIAVKYSIFYKHLKPNLFFSMDQNFIEKIYFNFKNNFKKEKLYDKNIIKILFPNYNDINKERKKPNNIYIINEKSNYEINNLDELNYRIPDNDLSGNKAIYLAIYLGFKNIILCGFDSINPNIKNPEISDKQNLHFDDFHKNHKNYNDVIKRKNSFNSNIKKFFKLINEQKNDNKKINITFL